MQTRQIVADQALMAELRLDPASQLIGAQCSGTLVLAKLGLLGSLPACTDLTTKPWVQEAGVEVLNQPFVARGNIATAVGCLASTYLAAWVIARLQGREAARRDKLARWAGIHNQASSSAAAAAASARPSLAPLPTKAAASWPPAPPMPKWRRPGRTPRSQPSMCACSMCATLRPWGPCWPRSTRSTCWSTVPAPSAAAAPSTTPRFSPK